MRQNFNDNKINATRTISNINYLDVILTVIFYEESCLFKYGIENSSLGNSSAKLIINDYTFKIKNSILNYKDKTTATKIINSKTQKRVKVELEFLEDDFKSKSYKDNECYNCDQSLNLIDNVEIEEFIDKFSNFINNNKT